ncbi:patatin-like phospholipase family protein [Actimicrobium antarcticum]|uniref:PNPLA domain-containing protein n=1 Tax=Actimicrobium antarcticum TaxID=1051899 RepID=A0ABP7T923_9BURK
MSMGSDGVLTIQAGPAALDHLRRHGLRAGDVAAIAGAAGGPKGLILQAIDQFLFGEWLPQAPRQRTLIGASIGAWRMAAACHADPASAFQRLGDLYCEQRYPRKPSPQLVSEVCIRILQDFVGGHENEIVDHPQHKLNILVSRGRGLLQQPTRSAQTVAGFATATLANLASRKLLARHLDRVIFSAQPTPWLATPFDAFDTRFAPLQQDNLATALLASGTLPFIMPPVTAIPHAPPGTYWDGGLIDYHLALPYARLAGQPEGGLVLYPHFTNHLVPGWLDKPLCWRRAGRGTHRHWLDNVILISPSQRFLQALPRQKLPDRSDFMHHGLDHAARIADWRTAIRAGQRLRDALAAFIARPDPALVMPL